MTNNKASKLEDLGWDDFFQTKKVGLNLDDFSVARVTAEQKGLYKIKNENGEFLAKITGKQMFDAESREDFPAVGDWVAITELDNQQATINSVLPRKSTIKRKFGDKDRAGEKSDVQMIAANIDVAFIVQSIGRDFSLNRFERYLALLKDANVKPVAIINKTDLISAKEAKAKQKETKERLDGVDVILTSSINGKGIDQLKKQIKRGKTCCFLGSSGVGKSSLINRLLGKEIIKTENIGSHSERGKHVTTSRQMYFLPARQGPSKDGVGGGIVIDNPGIREVGLTKQSESVDSLFDEISGLAKKCKYSDCTHVHEPGCEVLAALKRGELKEEQYSNFMNLRKETQFHAMNKFQKKEKNRQFGKFIKNAKKDFKKFNQKYH